MSLRRCVSVLLAFLVGASSMAFFAPQVRAEPAASPELTADRANAFLDKALPAQLADFALPGAAAVIVADGEILTARGFGQADLSTGAAVDPDAIGMFTGSVGKTFTATAVQQLVERGRLDLDRDVNDYLEGWAIADTYPGRPVTLRHLLTHTAGFDYQVPLGAGSPDDHDERTLREVMEEEQPRRVRPPGEGRVSYDNYAPALAGLIVEEVSGQPFAEYVQEHIFDPLQMTGSSVAQPQPEKIAARAAKAYRVGASGQIPTSGRFGPLTPSGAAAVTTAGDMGRFMLAQLPGAERTVLKPASVQKMQATQATPDPALPGMGLVWELYEHNEEPMVAKDGDIPGAHTNMIMLPDQNVGLYVAYNGDGTDNSGWLAGKQLQRQFLERFFPEDAGGSAPGQQDWDSDAEAFSGTYLARNTSRSELIGASGLVGGVSVDVEGQDSLHTTDPMAEDPEHAERAWVRVGERQFQESGGTDQLVFTADGTSMAMSSLPMYSYERIPAIQSPTLHQAVLYGGLAPLIMAMIGWPIVAVVRRRRQAERPSALARSARLVAWVAGAAMIAYVISFLRLMGDGAALNETLFLGDSPLLIIVRVVSTLAAAGAVAMIAFSIAAWKRHWWGVMGRVIYTLSTLGLLASLAVCVAHSMIGPGLW